MSYTPYKETPSINTDAGGRTRVSEITTLFDGKCLGQDNTKIWENVGTGTPSFSNNIAGMSVTAGQYQIRRGRQVTPYFSGKSQIIETTFDNMGSQAGVAKSVGYFSSTETAPYSANKDGFWLQVLESDQISIEIAKNGVSVASIPFTSWDNYELLKNYDFNKFSILVFSYLWLGGSSLTLHIKTEDGFVLAHTFDHASINTGTFIESPNHSVRYEIRSTTGAGNMNAICSTVATEGSLDEEGENTVFVDTTPRSTNNIGTIYALKSVKKLANLRDLSVTVNTATLTNNTSGDYGVGLILLNPTLSNPLDYVTNGRISEGTTSGSITVSNVGTVLGVISAGNTGEVSGLNKNVLAKLGMNIDNTSDEIVLAYQPTTANQAMLGTLGVKVY